MHLLYLDESGNENDAKDDYFVLAGLSLFERQVYFLSGEIDKIQERHFPGKQPIPFHASEIRAGRGFWRKVPEKKRSAVLAELVEAIVRSPDRGRILFAAAIQKTAELWGDNAVERATEEICRRFDLLLTRKYQDEDDPQRGLIIFSEGRFDARAKLWVKGFRERGASWGAINNLADIPYFASMRESRPLQAADFIAHGVWLLFEKRDGSLIKPLIHTFDNRDGVLHGLVHVKPQGKFCECPACTSRHSNGRSLGPWVA